MKTETDTVPDIDKDDFTDASTTFPTKYKFSKEKRGSLPVRHLCSVDNSLVCSVDDKGNIEELDVGKLKSTGFSAKCQNVTGLAGNADF